MTTEIRALLEQWAEGWRASLGYRRVSTADPEGQRVFRTLHDEGHSNEAIADHANRLKWLTEAGTSFKGHTIAYRLKILTLGSRRRAS